MALVKQTGLAGWTGKEGVYFTSDGKRDFGANFRNDEHLRLEAILERLAQVSHATSGGPTSDHDRDDTAGIGRPFRAGAIWTDTDELNIWACTDDTAGAAVWTNLSGQDAKSSSSSSSSSSSTAALNTSSSDSSSSDSSSSSSSESSSSTLAGNTSSSDSTMSSSSTSSSSNSSSSSSESSSSSSSTVAGNTSSSSSSSTQAGNTSSSSSSP